MRPGPAHAARRAHLADCAAGDQRAPGACGPAAALLRLPGPARWPERRAAHSEETRMKIGVPTEIKPSENRVAMVPAGVDILVRDGHQVLVQQGAGLGSGIPDADYVKAGATLL